MSSDSGPIGGTRRVRDLLILQVGGPLLVIGCDSCGGVGPKERDVVRVPSYIVGRFTSRVALMEVMASGASPVCLVDTLCCEPDPAGAEVLRGIEDELAAAGLAGRVEVTGSSEKNIPVVQTGVGVTVIGVAAGGGLRLGTSERGDEVVCAGASKVGSEISLDDREIADIPALSRLMGAREAHEVVPAGSRGILHEARELAASSGLSFVAVEPPPVDLLKSAGPATCLVATVEPGASKRLADALNKPVFHVGWLR